MQVPVGLARPLLRGRGIHTIWTNIQGRGAAADVVVSDSDVTGIFDTGIRLGNESRRHRAAVRVVSFPDDRLYRVLGM